MTRPPPNSTLFPHTPLSRSSAEAASEPPLVGGGGRFLLCADLRLDNREDLSRRIGVASAQLSDAELLMAAWERWEDRKSTRLNSSHANISYAVFCLKKKKKE